MNRPFSEPAVLQQMLHDRATGWSLASLMQKYHVKSHRSIVYMCQKHNVFPMKKPLVIYHVLPIPLALTIRRAVKSFLFCVSKVVSIQYQNTKLVDKISWYAVESFVRDKNVRTKPMYSFAL